MSEFLWQCEDDLEIGRRQQVAAAGFQPFFRAMMQALRTTSVAARVIRKLDMAALIAFVQTAAQLSGATELYIANRPELTGHQTGSEAVNVLLGMLAEYVRKDRHEDGYIFTGQSSTHSGRFSNETWFYASGGRISEWF